MSESYIIGQPLTPQPQCEGSTYLDCCENEDGTEFTFFTGNSMEGHTAVYGPIKAIGPGLIPKLDNEAIWRWEVRSRPTLREWYKNHPIIGPRLLEEERAKCKKQ